MRKLDSCAPVVVYVPNRFTPTSDLMKNELIFKWFIVFIHCITLFYKLLTMISKYIFILIKIYLFEYL